MSLGAFQDALARTLVDASFRRAMLADASRALAAYDLTDLERRRLLGLDHERVGAYARVVGNVKSRMMRALVPPNVTGLLSDDELEAYVRAYSAEFPGRDIYPRRESTLHMLRWLERTSTKPRVVAMARYERIGRMLGPMPAPPFPRARPESRVRLGAHVALVSFPCDVRAILEGEPAQEVPIVLAMRRTPEGLVAEGLAKPLLATLKFADGLRTVEELGQAVLRAHDVPAQQMAQVMSELLREGTLQPVEVATLGEGC